MKCSVAYFSLMILVLGISVKTVPAQSGRQVDRAQLQKLIYDLARNAVTERAQAVATLKELGPAAKDALPMLRAAYAREEPGPIKTMMLEAIASIEGRGASSPVIKPTDLKATARGLLVFLQQLDHKNPVVQRKALAGLRKLGALAEPAMAKLQAKAKSDPDASTRRMANLAVRAIQQQQWFAEGQTGKSESDPQEARVINTADELIALLGSRLKKIVEQLAEKLEDSDKTVRIKAARQLMQMGAAADLALPRLQKMAAKDPDVTTRRAAGLAVRQISKSVDDTRLWYKKQGGAAGKTFTIDQVNAVRKSSGFDKQAMSIGGIAAVGTGGNGPNNAWIVVLCKTNASALKARKLLGDQHKGVPIRYKVSGSVQKQ